MGVHPTTGKPKLYYSRVSAEEARRLADLSRRAFTTELPADLGFGDDTLWGFYARHVWPTVEPLADNWKSQVSWAMTKYIAPELGHVKLSDLSRSRLQTFFNHLAQLKDDDGGPRLAPSSINRIKTVVSRILNLAEADGAITINPIRHVRTAPDQITTRRSLRPWELRILYESAPAYGKRAILLMGFCGLRVGECCGLLWSDVDAKGVMRPSGQVLQLAGGARRKDTLKTRSSYAPVPIPEGIIEILRAGNDSIFVAPATNGSYLLPNNIDRMLDEAAERAGIGHVRPHELRHTFISILENVLELPATIAGELSRKAVKTATSSYSRSWLELRMKHMERYFEVVMNAPVPPDHFADVSEHPSAG